MTPPFRSAVLAILMSLPAVAFAQVRTVNVAIQMTADEGNSGVLFSHGRRVRS
jgi:hypothetical protein